MLRHPEVGPSRLAAACLVMLCGTLIGCGGARAPAPGPNPGLTLGFSADPLLISGAAAIRARWIRRAVAVGASIVRVNVDWSRVAPAIRPPGFDPADPASRGYSWSAVDAAVRDLTAHRLRVLLTVWDAPSWAQAPGRPPSERPGTWRPDPAQFGRFARAIALRYSGSYDDPHAPGGPLPAVRLWQAWNEPNLDYYLSPQWVRAGSGWAPVAPVVYRRMLNSFYAAVKAVSASNFVVMAGTAPYGDPLGQDPAGQERIQPVSFYRDVFCLRGARLTPAACPDPAHLDAVDHHPYGVGGPVWHALNDGDVAVPDVYKIARVLGAAVRSGRALPARPKSIWVSELGWSSTPPNPHAVPVLEDARWLEQALYVLWGQGVTVVLPLEIGDPAPIPSYSSVFESGLYYRDGHPKPLAQAFRFPFVSERLRPGLVRAWGRAPTSGQLRLQVLGSGGWRTVAGRSIRAGEVFVVALRIWGPATLRAQVGSQPSLTWSQGG